VADPTSTSTVPTVSTPTVSTPTVSTPTVSTGPGASMATVVPPNQTKILGVDPSVAPPTAVPAAATPRPPTSASPAAAASAPAETAATVSADSPGLRALVGLTTADQRRVDAGIARSESDVATLRAAFDAAQAELTARQGDEQAAQAAVDAAQGDLAGADSRLAAMELAAVSAADAVGRRRTPVASPPSPGHTPLDAAVQARQDLIAATADRDRRRATLDDRGHDLDRAQQAQADAAQVFTARADDLQQGLDALDQARQELSPTASDSAAALRPAPTALATATIPADYLALYGRAAATCSGLSWLVLAGIGSVESAHGTSGAAGVHAGANVAGAMGPMQFLAGTWATYGADGDGDGVRDVYNPADAIFGAARYLCASGAGDISTLRRALWAYNHADWYVEQVLQIAARY
jgi:hypothetical protein